MKQTRRVFLKYPEKLHGVSGSFRRNDSRHDSVSCIFSWDGEELFACQNVHDGASTHERFGNLFSWQLSSEEITVPEDVECTEEVTFSRRLYEIICRIEHFKGRQLFVEWKMQLHTGMSNAYYGQIDASLIGNYFDSRDGLISYCPRNSIQKTSPSGRWAREGRLTMKTGKFILQLMNAGILKFHVANEDNIEISDTLTPVQYKTLITAFCEAKSGLVKSDALSEKVMVSTDVKSIYQMAYAEGTGDLESSCMRRNSGHSCRHGVDWYNMIGAKIAYIKDAVNNELLARALLWDDCVFRDDPETKFKFMDRIYGNEACTELMKEWANENGYAYREAQNAAGRSLIMPDGTRTSKHYFCTKEVTKFNDYTPYFDTLTNLSMRNRVLQTWGDSDVDDKLIGLQSTSGGQLSGAYLCSHCRAVTFPRRERFVVDAAGNSEKGCGACVIEATDHEGVRRNEFRENVIEYFDQSGRRTVRRPEHVYGEIVRVCVSHVYYNCAVIGVIETPEDAVIINERER